MALKHKTPLLDELESGPWPSFVTDLKKMALFRKEFPERPLKQPVSLLKPEMAIFDYLQVGKRFLLKEFDCSRIGKWWILSLLEYGVSTSAAKNNI